MAGGGTFDTTVVNPKKRPGTYINTKSERPAELSVGVTGVMLFPILAPTWGPDREPFVIESKDLNGQMAKLGYDLNYENENTVALRAGLQNAKEVICYPVLNNGERAKAEPDDENITLTATAMYAGTRGNDLKYSIVANPAGGNDVTIYLADEVVERFEGLKTAAELIAANSEWIVFEGKGDLTPVAAVDLEGGTDAVVTNYDITKFLDWAEHIKWNSMAFQMDGEPEDADETTSAQLKAVMQAVVSKIKYLREQVGKDRRAAIAGYQANYDGVTNCTVGGFLDSGYHLTRDQFTAWYAGLDCSVSKTTSLTNYRLKGMAKVDRPLTDTEVNNAIDAGELVLTLNDDNLPVIEYDINSLTDFDPPRDRTYRKNRVIRTLDALRDKIRQTFPPNKYDNDETGWSLMEAAGKLILLDFQSDHALRNVDVDTDFLVDRTMSKDEYTYFDVSVQPVDSAEKLYFRLSTK